MEIGGLVIVAAFVVALSSVPHLIARRTAITQSRDRDRFSPRLRLLQHSDNATHNCDEASGMLLAQRRTFVVNSGEDMGHTQQSTPEIRVDRLTNQKVREISKLRARRAARLSAEAAAGQRRMVIAGVLAVTTLLLAVIVATTPLTWPWILPPAAALAASLGLSRFAALRSQRASAEDMRLLAELREGAAHTRTTAHVETAVVEHNSDGGNTTVTQTDALDNTDDVTNDHEKETHVAQSPTQSEVVESSSDVTHETATETADAGTVTSDAVETSSSATVERRTWTVGSIPAPSYTVRAKVTGRVIHADTDLRGIPRVDATVPARPHAVTPTAGARSTEQVIADQDIVLDLDAVLDARRAQ